MDEFLIVRLLAATALTNLVGQTVTYIERPEESDFPGVTLLEVSTGLGGAAGMHHHGGMNDWQSPRFQFDCWGSSPMEAKLVARALIAELQEPAEVTVGASTVAFDEGLLDTKTDEPAEELPGGTKVFRVRVDMLVPWRLI